MSKSKLIITSFIFYLIGILITFGMIKVWFWLFNSHVILTILIFITLFGSVKYFWKHTQWTIKNWKQSTATDHDLV